MEEASMEQARRRRPVAAFLLSYFVPGLGQLYNGNALRGALLFVGFWALFIAFTGLTRLIYSLWALGCIGAAFFIAGILVAADAAIGAGRLKTIQLKWYNKWYLYVCVLLTLYIAFVPAVKRISIDHISGMRSYRMPASSMEPSLKTGDHFIAKLERFGDRLPSRGDVIIFPYPENTSKDFVKRVIGLPGERLEIKDKVVFNDGQRIEDPWGVSYSDVILPGDLNPRDNFGPISIPQGAVFVMGDNRDFSHDSRFWGFVEIKNITARALFIYWSDDKSRIGKQLQ
jgi:signal peptidase I